MNLATTMEGVEEEHLQSMKPRISKSYPTRKIHYEVYVVRYGHNVVRQDVM